MNNSLLSSHAIKSSTDTVSRNFNSWPNEVLEENRQLQTENKQHKEQELLFVQQQDEQQQELRHMEIELSMRGNGSTMSKPDGDPAKEAELRKDVQVTLALGITNGVL